MIERKQRTAPDSKEAGIPARLVTQQGDTRSAAERSAPPASDVDGLWSALKEVRDPELPISVVDLGLVYAIRRAGERAEVDLTFTATACPCMDFISEDIRDRLLEEPGIRTVEIRVVWDPPWTTARMTAEGREALRRYGVAA